jgi:hypothetical protein
MSEEVLIKRDFTAERLNAVLNHPDVRPDVAEMGEGELDLTKAVENKNNVLLMGDFGGFFSVRIMPGVYEVHTQILPGGRGAWAFEAARVASHWMFTHTDAFEIVTRVPRGHMGAKALATSMGMRFEFTADTTRVFRGVPTKIDVYSYRVQDWFPLAQGFVEQGRQFHKIIGDQITKVGRTRDAHEDMPTHNHYVGGCLEMCENGQVRKGVVLYNRWAAVARHTFIELVSEEPPKIKFDVGFVTLNNGKLEFEPC